MEQKKELERAGSQPNHWQSNHAQRIKSVAYATGVILVGIYITPFGSDSQGSPPILEPQAELPAAILPTAQEQEPDPTIARKNNPNCTWITDKPSGHYIGYACKGDTITKLHNSYSRKYAFGIIRRNGRQICGWVDAGVLKTKKRDKPYSTCMKLYGKLNDRYTVGKNFNCGERRVNGITESKCVDGAQDVPLSDDCDGRFYRNSASKRQSATNLRPSGNSGLYDYVGQQTEPIAYRYTKLKGIKKNAMSIVVRSDKYGWGEMSSECIDEIPRHGPKKYSNSIAGPNPNAKRKK